MTDEALWTALTSDEGYRGWKANEPDFDEYTTHPWFTHLRPIEDEWGYEWLLVQGETAEAVREAACERMREKHGT